MSSDTDLIFGAGLQSVAHGLVQDRAVEKQFKSDVIRAKGIETARMEIQQLYSPSGWVDRKTGKPILQTELEAIPENNRILATDYERQAKQKNYDFEKQMSAQDKPTEFVHLDSGQPITRRELNSVPENKRITAREYEKLRKKEDLAAKTAEEDRSFDKRMKQQEQTFRHQLEEKVRVAKEVAQIKIDSNKNKVQKNKNLLTPAQTLELRQDIEDRYKNIYLPQYEEESTGFFGGKKKDAKPKLSLAQFAADENPNNFVLVYGAPGGIVPTPGDGMYDLYFSEKKSKKDGLEGMGETKQSKDTGTVSEGKKFLDSLNTKSEGNKPKNLIESAKEGLEQKANKPEKIYNPYTEIDTTANDMAVEFLGNRLKKAYDKNIPRKIVEGIAGKVTNALNSMKEDRERTKAVVEQIKRNKVPEAERKLLISSFTDEEKKAFNKLSANEQSEVIAYILGAK